MKKSQTQPVCKLWTVEIVRADSISSFCLRPALHMFVNRKFAKKNRQLFQKTGTFQRQKDRFVELLSETIFPLRKVDACTVLIRNCYWKAKDNIESEPIGAASAAPRQMKEKQKLRGT